SLWTDLTPCEGRAMGPYGYYELGSSMDAQLAFPSDVTNAGFWLRAGSSLENNECGGDKSVVWSWTPNVVNWIAMGVKSSFCQSGRWSSITNNATLITVTGNNACDTGAVSQASCPAGKKISGGGYFLTSWWAPGHNSPDSSYPVNDTTWAVVIGGDSHFCAAAQIVCR
ncbi:hypothetical protein, partial [Chromobacterium subtsugae]|uniref:hypothetical protein n=1 Tax=Chromobacterium subtsugae TaxID=251747 RepID=UPI001C1292D9